ncbi:MAG: CBS domain-containing protein [Anaerolineales bacterium]|nr:CBS domain-containing protein [Anaerolineales bacterium]
MKRSRTVLESKRYGVFSCRPETTLLSAARQMVREDVSCLIVVDDAGYLAGILSRFDLVRACIESEVWESRLVADLMTAVVVTVSPETTMLEVANLLLEKQIHRVVAVREENGRLRPFSVISASDLIYHMIQDAEPAD